MNMPGGWLAVALWFGGIVIAALVTWAICRWWYGRKLVAAAQRLHKSDKGRLFSQQQTQQARKQIEQLRAEIEALRKKPSDAHRERARELESVLADAEEAMEAERASFQPAAHGFADTQILP